MKFSREALAATTVRHIAATGIRIGDTVYSDTLLVTGDSVASGWTDKPVDELGMDDFESLLDTGPELILLGCGERGSFPPRALTFGLARRGVGLECMDTAAAARTFNVLVGEGRKVAAVLYPLSDQGSSR